MDPSLAHILSNIPKGKVTSYAAVARALGIHPRAVARLLAGNEHPDTIPCYKVVRSDGSLGGYNLGITEKIRRLESDGIIIRGGKIPSEYFWKP